MSTEVTTAQMNYVIGVFDGKSFMGSHITDYCADTAPKMKYHTDLGLLMRVIEKLKDRLYEIWNSSQIYEQPQIEISLNTNTIKLVDVETGWYLIDPISKDTLKETVYRACYEINKWLNQQKQTMPTERQLDIILESELEFKTFKQEPMASKEYTKEYLKENIEPLLIVGASIKIGKQYVDECGGFSEGQIITLVEGYFERDNGLYDVTETAPSVWNEGDKEFDSIYHMFGNDLENWFDCEIVKTNDNDTTGTNKG